MAASVIVVGRMPLSFLPCTISMGTVANTGKKWVQEEMAFITGLTRMSTPMIYWFFAITAIQQRTFMDIAHTPKRP